MYKTVLLRTSYLWVEKHGCLAELRPLPLIVLSVQIMILRSAHIYLGVILNFPSHIKLTCRNIAEIDFKAASNPTHSCYCE